MSISLLELNPQKAEKKQKGKSGEFILTSKVADERPVFICGNFNGWKARDEKYRLERIGKNQYRFVFENIENLPSPLIYKYVKGNWDNEELDNHGNIARNRITFDVSQPIRDTVNCWRMSENKYNPQFLPKIEIISEQFEIPQLEKKRRIAVLLPFDYYVSDKKYPVLYLQDGQNLFDDYAPYGNWGVDKNLALLAEEQKHEVIIVAIDHGGKDRIVEYTPIEKTKFGKGFGKKYIDFLANTLKPYIDANYRVLTDRAHTGIGGSSMGALISIYAGLQCPHVFSKMLIFSPSLWIAPKIYFDTVNSYRPFDTKCYLYGGEKEGSNMVQNLHRFKEALLVGEKSPHATEIMLQIDPNGQHNEARWGVEFPNALKWLYF